MHTAVPHEASLVKGRLLALGGGEAEKNTSGRGCARIGQTRGNQRAWKSSPSQVKVVRGPAVAGHDGTTMKKKIKLSEREQGLLDEQLLAAIMDAPRDALGEDEEEALLRISALLAKGAKPVAAVNKAGRDALILAAKRGSAKMVALFLEAGANPLAQDIWGYSALAWAATRNVPECIEMLIPVSNLQEPDGPRSERPLMLSIQNHRGDDQSKRSLSALLAIANLSQEQGYGPSFADDLERDGMEESVVSAVRQEVAKRAALAEAAALSEATSLGRKTDLNNRRGAL